MTPWLIRSGDKEGASPDPGEDGIVEEAILPTSRGLCLCLTKAKLVEGRVCSG